MLENQCRNQLPQKRQCTNMKQQRGAFLIELIFTIGILILVSFWAVPELSQSLTQSKMENATRTIQHTIQRARLTARNRNTWVALELQNGQITFTPQSEPSQVESIRLPSDIIIINDIMLRYTPNGLLDTNDQGMLNSRLIQLHAQNGRVADVQIIVNSMGLVGL